MEAEGLLEGDRRSGLLRRTRDDRGIQVDDDPAGQALARHHQPGETTRPQVQQAPHVSADLRPGFRDLGEHHLIEGIQRPAGRGVRHRRPEKSLVVGLQLLGLQQVRGTERDRHRQGDQHLGPIPPARHGAGREHPGQRRRQPRTVRALAQQHRPGMPDQPLPVGHHGQPTVPSRSLAHQKGALTLATDTDSTLASLQVMGTFR
jgi:hypothetical protein